MNRFLNSRKCHGTFCILIAFSLIFALAMSASAANIPLYTTGRNNLHDALGRVDLTTDSNKNIRQIDVAVTVHLIGPAPDEEVAEEDFEIDITVKAYDSYGQVYDVNTYYLEGCEIYVEQEIETITYTAAEGVSAVLVEFRLTNEVRGDYFIMPPISWNKLNSVSDITVSKSVHILYDSSCNYTASQLNSYFSSAVEAFSSEFLIDFNCSYTSSSALLNGSSCPNTGTAALCTAACGSLSNCGTNHHKGAGRLLDVATSTSYYTYRFVGHKLCYYDAAKGTHSGVAGLGDRLGKDAITSVYSSSNIARSIQHELTHNLGGSHSTCDSNQLCVLQGDMNYWCDTCRLNILENR
ncbi:MAG: hypothetical protein IKD31_03505 [Clostridia bacterium]|nr:hypothetical protein [Clostridia bacterium]